MTDKPANWEEYRLPSSECPFCGYLLDAATCVDRPAVKPSPGDLSICLKCLSFLRFRDDLSIEPLPDVEFRTLPEDIRTALHHMRRMAGPIDRS